MPDRVTLCLKKYAVWSMHPSWCVVRELCEDGCDVNIVIGHASYATENGATHTQRRLGASTAVGTCTHSHVIFESCPSCEGTAPLNLLTSNLLRSRVSAAQAQQNEVGNGVRAGRMGAVGSQQLWRHVATLGTTMLMSGVW